jgi:hypothetical protein
MQGFCTREPQRQGVVLGPELIAWLGGVRCVLREEGDQRVEILIKYTRFATQLINSERIRATNHVSGGSVHT